MIETGAEASATRTTLPEAVARHHERKATAEELAEVFLRSTVYFQRPEEPGFLAVGEPGSGMIPVFSSLAELARFAGACAWASTIGEDLLGLAPAGFVFLLDPLGRHPHRFDPGPWQARGAGPDRTTEATGMTSSIATPGAPGGAA